RQRTPDFLDAFLNGFAIRIDNHARIERRLVRIGNAGEVIDLARERALVKALGITARQDFNGALDIDFQKSFDRRARLIAGAAIWGDCGDNNGHTVARQQSGNEADPADVGVAVIAAETESLRKMLADDVAIEQLHARPALTQPGNEAFGQRRLARAGESGEPDREAFVRHALG